MPRGNKNKNSNSRRKNSSNSSSVSAFETRCRANVLRYNGSLYLSIATPVAGANVFGLNPTVLGALYSPSLLAISNCFTEYRFTKVMFRAFSASGNVQNYCIAYNPEVISSAVTIQNALQSPYSLLVPAGGSNMTPLELVLNKSVLMSGAAKWWKCVQAGTADDWDEIQGQVDIVAALTTPNIQIEMYYTIELTGLSNTPTNFDTVQRRSLVKDDQAAIDLVVPGRPFVIGKSVDTEWLRVKKLVEERTKPVDKEVARILALS